MPLFHFASAERKEPPNPKKPPIRPPDGRKKPTREEPPDPNNPGKREHPPIGDPPRRRAPKKTSPTPVSQSDAAGLRAQMAFHSILLSHAVLLQLCA